MSICITAIICTYNRAQYLCKAIESLIEQTIPPERYEILVVDNCSTDNTKQVVLEAQNVAHNVRYIYEPIQGLSRSRNTGLASAFSEYIAYIDDDAIASKKWLKSILDRFMISYADAIGGPSYLDWENEPHTWLPPVYWGYLGRLDLGDMAKPLRSPEYPYGLNMAFRKSSLEKVGGFPTCLGRSGNNLISNEERAVFLAMENGGMRVWYEPEAIVHHFVPAERASDDFLTNRLFAQGVSDAIFHQRIQKINKLYYIYKLIQSIGSIMFVSVSRLLITQGPAETLKANLSIAYWLGYISKACANKSSLKSDS